MVKLLGHEARGRFLQHLDVTDLRGNLTTLFQTLAKLSEYNERAILSAINASKRTKGRLLESLGNLLSTFLLLENGIENVECKLEVIRVFVSHGEWSCLELIVQEVVDQLTTTEDFEKLQTLLHLLSDTPLESQWAEIRSESRKALSVILTLESLLEKVLGLRLQIDSEKFDAQIEKVIGELDRISPTISFIRQKLLESKLRARALILRGDHLGAIRHQVATVEFLENHASKIRDWEFEFVKESRILTQLFWETGQKRLFWERSRKLVSFPATTARAISQKCLHQFPLYFVIAIEDGDSALGFSAIESFESIVSKRKSLFTSHFLSQNAYYQAYFHFAIGEIPACRKQLAKIFRFDNNEILPAIGAMARVLQILISIKEVAVDETLRLLRNLKKSSSYDLGGCVEFVHICTNIVREIEEKGQADSSLRESIYLLDNKPNLDLFRYFSLRTWLQAQVDRRPMIEIFANRASDPSDSNQRLSSRVTSVTDPSAS